MDIIQELFQERAIRNGECNPLNRLYIVSTPSDRRNIHWEWFIASQKATMHTFPSSHVAQLLDKRAVAMTSARMARVLQESELVSHYVREARVITRLIVNARRLVAR